MIVRYFDPSGNIPQPLYSGTFLGRQSGSARDSTRAEEVQGRGL